ncbi:MAG: prohibitin family protein, partial [Sphingobacteriales bacterium]
MVFIVLGFVILLVSVLLSRSAEPQAERFRPILRIAGFLILLAGIASASIRQIEAGEVGVQTLFGQVQNRTLESGLNFVNPAVDV